MPNTLQPSGIPVPEGFLSIWYVWEVKTERTVAMFAAIALLLLIGYSLLTLVILLVKQLRVSDIDGMYLPETTTVENNPNLPEK